MLTPYRLLIVLLLALGIFGSGTYLGYQYAAGHYAKAAAEAQNAFDQGVREQAAVDKQEAIDRVRRETLAAAKAQSAKDRGMSDANLKANPNCSRDAESISLLVDAVTVANGAGANAGSVPEAVLKPPASKWWVR